MISETDCFGGGTILTTKNGLETLEQIGDDVLTVVLSHKNIYRYARAHVYDKPVKMQRVVFRQGVRDDTDVAIWVSPKHQWLLADGTVTNNLQVGNVLWYYDENALPWTAVQIDAAREKKRGWGIDVDVDHGFMFGYKREVPALGMKGDK